VVLRDRLGSTLDTIDGSLVTQRAFDAFGKARNGDLSDRPNGTLNLGDTIHGFTTHTHADDVALVHMGGRVFDPNLGRFLSVDPIAGGGSQGLNPYSYLANRPFSGTDPSGYEGDCVVAQGNSCSVQNNDSRSADKLGHTTFVMGSDNNVRGYGSDGSSFVAVDNTGRGGGGNGGPVVTSTTGGGGAVNQHAEPPAQMGLTNEPSTQSGQQTPTLPTVSVTASSFLGDVWDSVKIEFQLLLQSLPTRDEYDPGTYNAFAPFGSVPTRRERLEAQRGHLANRSPAAAIVGGAIATLPLIVVPGEGEAEAALGAEARAVVIGEDMQGRVIPTAKALGVDWYRPRGSNPETWMRNNRRWINKQMDQGCRIFDCGPAPGRTNYPGPTSPSYKMELDQIRQRSYQPYELIKAEGE
jgi:RHS repeat-associated protein